jgi:guanine nucleotide exchange factor VAV
MSQKKSFKRFKTLKASITDWNLPNGTELKDYGRLRKDGEIKIQSHDATNGKTKLRYIFVFDRVIPEFS